MTTKSIMNLGFLLFFIAIYIFVHHLASYSFPIPWPDESAFLWQAISFQKTHSLYAPQLNPNRPILWMPPGYMVLTGTVFKIFGFSLNFARTLSLMFIIATFVLLTCMTRKYGFQTLSLLFCGLFFLNKQFVVTGNIARMEALLLVIICAGFFLLQSNRDYKGLALLSISPLVHPNGLYFFMGAVAYFLLSGRFRFRNRNLTRSDIAFVLLSVFLWLVYAFYIGHHWQEFLSDMSFQFNRKGHRDILSALFTPYKKKILLLLMVAFLCVYGLKRNIQAIFLLVFGVPAWFVSKIGQEMWYAVFDSVFYLFFSIVLLHVVHHLLESMTILKLKLIRHVIIAIVTLSLLFAYHKVGLIESPIDFPSNIRWAGLRMPGDVPYLKNSDVAEIRAFLNSLQSSNHPVHVQFYPSADALFFQDMDGKTVRFSQPLFLEITPDVYIIHVSRYLPYWWTKRTQNEFRRAGIDPLDKVDVLRQRDETEIWYYRLARLEKP